MKVQLSKSQLYYLEYMVETSGMMGSKVARDMLRSITDLLDSELEVNSMVEYAKLIGKNTRDFTAKDISGFLKWLNKRDDAKLYDIELSKEEHKILVRVCGTDTKIGKWTLETLQGK